MSEAAAEQQTQPAGGSLSESYKNSRERYWEEASAEQKVERLRDEVARLCKLVTEQAGFIMKLMEHSHADGKLLSPILRGGLDQPIGYFAHDNGIPHSLRKQHERGPR